MKKKALIALLVLFTLAVGFVRDYIFVSYNKIIEAGLDEGGELMKLKWMLTLVFSFIYFLISWAFLKVIFGSQKYTVAVVASYVLLLVFSSLGGLYGLLFSSFQDMYPFIRSVMGIAQSPVVTMTLIAACLVAEKTGKQQG